MTQHIWKDCIGDDVPLNTVVVVGGGPAGMLAAGAAGSQGKSVILLEKNNKLGKKLYITGKGRCNITNFGTIEELLDHVVTNRNFLYSAFYTFSNTDIVNLINKHGVPTKIERGNRVFPQSDKSSDVIKALTRYLDENNVEIRLNSEVSELKVIDGVPSGVELKDGTFIPSSKVIVATGGMSYPTTGSTGDGYRFAKNLGHRISTIKPALVPLETEESWVKELQGLSLKNILVSAYFNDQMVFQEFGEMLFTHFGISGPVPLTMSNYINKYLNNKNKVKIVVNLKPSIGEEALDKRIQKDFELYSNKHFKNSLNDLLPQKLIPVIISLSGIPENKYVNQITKEERRKILDLLTGLAFNIDGIRPITEAIVTSGGVNVKEINPSTMESKIIKGLSFAGEVIDVDALTGGYNLQIAFSTGYLAGLSI